MFLLFIAILISLPVHGSDTVSDYRFLEAEILKIQNAEEKISLDDLRGLFDKRELTFEAICFPSSERDPVPSELKGYVPQVMFPRVLLVRLSKLSYGFNLDAEWTLAETNTLFSDHSQRLTCPGEGTGCDSLNLKYDKEINGPEDDPITLTEEWSFYVAKSQPILAKGIVSVETVQRNWIGSPVDRSTFRVELNCILEPIDNPS